MMKKSIAGLIVCLIFAACSDEVSDQLKGKWQLQKVETDGVVTQVDTVWYNFQSESLFMYQLYQPATQSYLHTYGFKTQPDAHTLDLELTNYTFLAVDFLPYTDWSETKRTFNVDQISANHLVLSSGGKIYTFRKY